MIYIMIMRTIILLFIHGCATQPPIPWVPPPGKTEAQMYQDWEECGRIVTQQIDHLRVILSMSMKDEEVIKKAISIFQGECACG